MVKLLAERAPAKINLFLRVTGRRANGYHELDSIFVPVSITDRIRIEVRPSNHEAVTLHCNVASLGPPESNLATRAARAFMTEFGICAQVLMHLEKAIPVGAGLGGASSDGATVLRMLTAMHNIDAPGRLGKIAVALGADVPFFLDPRPSRVTGIGELIAPISGFPVLHLAIAAPAVEVPTSVIFRALKPEHWSGAASDHDIEEIMRGKIASRHLVNDLAAPAMENYPQIARLKALLEEAGAQAAAMTGSGGAVFGIFRDPDEALRAVAAVQSKAPEARVFAAKSLDFGHSPAH